MFKQWIMNSYQLAKDNIELAGEVERLKHTLTARDIEISENKRRMRQQSDRIKDMDQQIHQLVQVIEQQQEEVFTFEPEGGMN
jgi:predicted  nucleic acid-binding Zn-ribbon protein